MVGRKWAIWAICPNGPFGAGPAQALSGPGFRKPLFEPFWAILSRPAQDWSRPAKRVKIAHFGPFPLINDQNRGISAPGPVGQPVYIQWLAHGLAMARDQVLEAI